VNDAEAIELLRELREFVDESLGIKDLKQSKVLMTGAVIIFHIVVLLSLAPYGSTLAIFMAE
jgi:hypothetical protein